MTLQTLDDVLMALPEMRDRLKGISEIILANIVMVGEIPAPTFHEQQRIEFLCNRFHESDLLDISTDETDNVYGIFPGSEGDRNILVVAHTDTLFGADIDHTITVQSDQITGPAVGDNSLGVAVIASLPTVLEYLDIQLHSNLILMGASRSLGRGDQEGLRFFLSNTQHPICAGVAIEGIPLGRLSHESVGMLRGEIVCTVPDEYDWTRFGVTGAILTMNEVIDKLVQIPVPQRPRTVISFASLIGGAGFGRIAKQARLQLEVRSESEEETERIRERIEEIALEVSAHSNKHVELDIFARRVPIGIPFSHPLCRYTRNIMNTLGIQLEIMPSMSELSTLTGSQIPAITVGITHGDREGEVVESIEIEPIFTGLAQLIGILLAIDKGVCNEN